MATGFTGRTASNHLYFGGSIRTDGSTSAKCAAKNTYKKLKRLETMVRMEAAGIPEAATAAMLCISLARLKYLRSTADYTNARIKITHGIIIDTTSELSIIKEQRKEMLTQLLPAAFQVLANELQRPANTIAERKHQVSLMQDLMDREGTFAKVSRTEVKPVDSFDFERADEASRSIINTIRSVAAPTATAHTLAAVAANEAFSNSHTLSATDQQEALASLEAAAAEEALLLASCPTDGTIN